MLTAEEFACDCSFFSVLFLWVVYLSGTMRAFSVSPPSRVLRLSPPSRMCRQPAGPCTRLWSAAKMK